MKRISQLLILGAATSSLFAKEEPTSAPPSKPKAAAIEVCFVLDTTGSMGGLIHGAKEKIWSIANEISSHKPETLRMGLVAYRDKTDQYITQQTALTEDLDAIHVTLHGFQADGGGDGPESVNQALNEAITTFSWSPDSKVKKIIFLVGDAPPHMDYDEVQYPKLCELACEKGIIINSILCGSDQSTATIWNEIAQKCEGQYAAIPQSGGTVTIKTPFDKRINELNLALNDTVLCWGSHQQQSEVKGKISAINSSSFETQATRCQYATDNFAGKVISGQGDLISDWSDGKVKLSELKKVDLGEELSELSEEELKAQLEKNLAERKELQAELATQITKRSQFLTENKDKKETPEDSFDIQVAQIITKQLAQ